MRPIDVPTADTRHIGGPGIDDLPTESILELNPDDGSLMKAHRSRWRPNEDERMAIALGGDVVLDIFSSSIPPVRVLATAIPVETPDKVYATFDAILARGVAWSISSTLADVGYPFTIDQVAEWTTDQTKEVAEWMAARPGSGETVFGDLLDEWRTRRPEVLR